MKPYSVQIEVRILYTVEVHAEDVHDAWDRAWRLSPDEVEAQGSTDEIKTTTVEEPEEIQREDEEDE